MTKRPEPDTMPVNAGGLSRRAFLRQVGVLSAGVGILPSPLARANPSPREKVLRWGIIGTGARGARAHIPALKSFDQFEVLGACDVMEKHLDGALKTLGGKCQGYKDYQKLLANPDINAVMIATPNCWHKEMVVAALQAGKHVMCEKPMASSFEECKAIQAAIDSSSQVVLFTLQLRYSDHYQALRKAIETGKIGRPKYALMAEFRGDWNRDVWRYTDPRTHRSMNWRYSHAASGGTLVEKVCHYFDVLAWMMGEDPATVSCNGGITMYHDGRDTWDHATTVLTYPSGAKATHSLCMFAPNRNELQIIGDEGTLRSSNASPVLLVDRHGKQEEIRPPEEVRHGERGPAAGQQETGVLRMYVDFMDCVKNHKQPWTEATKALASSKTAWLAELSQDKDRPTHWNELS